MNSKKTNWFKWFDLITKIIAWVFGIIIIVMLVLMITGHSPDLDDLQSILIGGIIVFLVNLYGRFSYQFGRLESKLDSLIKSFSAMASDLKAHIKHKK